MMNMISHAKRLFLASVLVSALNAAAFGAGPVPVPQHQQNPVLGNADCVKCHAAATADIAANGGAHKTNVTCQDCHNGHPPAVKNIIPLCSQCHSGKPHYKLADCQRCHSNPHTPKATKLAKNITDECVTCHSQQIVKLRQFKSKHTSLACTYCHNVHGRIPPCTQCHKPHSADMVAAECKQCHQAHMPTVITYKPDTPNKNCAACHKKASDLLLSTDAKHRDVSCVTCHKDKHKMTPTCQSCHGTPHPAGMLARFTKCADCHSIAHSLNRWEPKAADKPATLKPKKKN
jgi:predicted CXXCH cytochrome family protein